MLTINGAGGLAANPILAGLGVILTLGASTFDVAAVNDAFIDQSTGFPGTNTMKAALSPAATVLTSGSTGGYNDTTKQWNIGSTTGLSVGDFTFLSHGLISDGFYRVASIVNATDVTFALNPLDGAGTQANVFFQVAWSWENAVGTAPSVSSAGGTENFFKAEVQDITPVISQAENSFFARNAPAAAALASIEGASYTGATVPDTALTLSILSGWANNGGVAFVEMANHSVQTVNNFTWTSGGGSGEVSLATALSGLTIPSGDGPKYGRLILKASAGAAFTVGIDIDATLDTAGPGLMLLASAA